MGNNEIFQTAARSLTARSLAKLTRVFLNSDGLVKDGLLTGVVGFSRKPTTSCSICTAKILQVTRPRGLVGLFDLNILSYLPVVAN